jgi:pyruvate dehydrogenase E1 component alpha subunit
VLLEAMNLASLWSLPVVFVCENNGYAVTLPVAGAVAGSITSRAEAFGMAAAQVDGMDVRAVHAAAAEAVERARSGGGPTFLECLTYRFQGHHTAEHLMKFTYRTEEEISLWRARDPLDVQGRRLDPQERARLDAEVEATIEAAIDFARRSPRPAPADALDYQYAGGLRPRTGVR